MGIEKLIAAADAPAYGMSQETLDALNGFSCKVETLKHMVDVLHRLLWEDAMDGKENAIEQAAHLTETLLEIVTIRDTEISEIIGQIRPLEVTGGNAP